MNLQWDPCVNLSGQECEDFIATYLDAPGRNCLLIGGAGFDPRSTRVASRLSQMTRASLAGIFFREERPMAQLRLREKADAHQAVLAKLIAKSQFPKIDILAEGLTPVGGRRAIQEILKCDFAGVTDVVLDISALSVGVFFPIVPFLLGKCKGIALNLHVMSIEAPRFDHQIRGIPCEAPTLVYGYRGTSSLDADQAKPLLWLPTLAPGAAPVLTKIYNFLSRNATPIDVCPIVPFPCHDPRLHDKLVVEFSPQARRWLTEYRNVLYAAESDPLDAYRTICSIYDARERTFRDLGGSTVVLSPVGNKLLAVGAMLAAIEKTMHVVMVESEGYEENVGTIEPEKVPSLSINSLWLAGEAYKGRA
jgi:hypothetical protein